MATLPCPGIIDTALGQTPRHWAFSLLALLSLLFLLTFLFTSLRCRYALEKGKASTTEPPIAPYWVPGIGHLLSILTDLDSLLSFLV